MSEYQGMCGIVSGMLKNDSRVFVAPGIPEKKFTNVMEAYGFASIAKFNFFAKLENTLVLVDDTLLGGSKEGCMLNIYGVYAKSFMQEPQFIPYSSITNVYVIKKKLLVNGVEIIEFGFQSEETVKILGELIKKLAKYYVEHEGQQLDNNENDGNFSEHFAAIKAILDDETIKHKDEMSAMIEESENVHKPKAVTFGINEGIKAGILAGAYFITKEIESAIQNNEDDAYIENLFEAFELIIRQKVELNNAYRHICKLPDEEVIETAEFTI